MNELKQENKWGNNLQELSLVDLLFEIGPWVVISKLAENRIFWKALTLGRKKALHLGLNQDDLGLVIFHTFVLELIL